MGFEPVVPTTPREGQYLPVVGYTETEGGGGVRVELTECPECHAAVAENRLDAHVSTHAAQAGGAPKR